MNINSLAFLSSLLILSSFVVGTMTNKQVFGKEIFGKIVKWVVLGA
jgi:hypothetical protein